MASWTVVCLAPLFLGFSRQECWSGLPSPTPGDISDPRIKHMPLASPALAGEFLALHLLGSPPSLSEGLKLYIPEDT